MENKPVKAYLGLGSNQGEVEETLIQGVKGLAGLPETRLTGISSLYTTAPVGYLEQADFLNAVVRVETDLSPLGLLEKTREIENSLGRIRTIRWGPRTLDIDILLYGNLHIQLPSLQIPHPRLTERAFVMVPLAELEPDLQVMGRSISENLFAIKEQKISLFKQRWFDKL